jgi:cell division protein FtsB
MAGTSRGPGSRRSGGPRPARPQRGSARPRQPADSTARTAAGAPKQRGSDGSPARRASLTGRAAVLALVLGVLAVSYAYPLRAWYDQHRERADLRAEAERLEAEVAELETQLRLWDDPAFVQAQARARLGYVLPGEVGYVVVDETGEPETELGPDGLPVLIEGEWYSRLWTSIQAADAVRPEDGQ